MNPLGSGGDRNVKTFVYQDTGLRARCDVYGVSDERMQLPAFKFLFADLDQAYAGSDCSFDNAK